MACWCWHAKLMRFRFICAAAINRIADVELASRRQATGERRESVRSQLDASYRHRSLARFQLQMSALTRVTLAQWKNTHGKHKQWETTIDLTSDRSPTSQTTGVATTDESTRSKRVLVGIKQQQAEQWTTGDTAGHRPTDWDHPPLWQRQQSDMSDYMLSCWDWK